MMGFCALCPESSHTSTDIVELHSGRKFRFGCRFGRGRGRLFNIYTRYYLDDLETRIRMWEGWPTNAPDPMNPSERRSVNQFLVIAKRTRIWLFRKIEQHIQKDGA